MAFSDVTLALRSLRRWPGGAAAALFVLALGIGATTAVFSLVHTVLLNPLAYRDPGRIVVALNAGEFPVSPANYLDLRAQARSFKDLGAAQVWGANLTGTGAAEQIPGLQLTPNLFRILGVQPLLGRLPDSASDDAPPPRVVLLSHALWQRRFGGDASIVGRELRLNSDTYTVAGVMPAGFAFPPFWATGAEMWAPLDLSARRADRAGSSLRIFGRLADGSGVESAQQEISALNARLIAVDPRVNEGLDLRVVPLHEKVTGKARPILVALLGASAFVLLIACANVGQLILARATGRRKELAVRVALGARSADLIRLIMAESVVLSALGGASGLLIASWSVKALAALAPADLPRIEAAALSVESVAFAVAASFLTAVLFGLGPAIRQLHTDPQLAMREEAANVSEGAGGRRLRRTLVVAEVAMAVVLTIGAGLLVRSFVNLLHIEPGFNQRNLLTLTVSVSGSQSAAPGRRLPFYDEILRQTRALPGVESAALINHLPVGGDVWGARVAVAGRDPDRRSAAVYRVADAGYFETMGIRLRQGRAFLRTDDLNAPRIAVINQSLARALFPSGDAVGARITTDDPRENPVWVTVAGVVSDVKQRDWSGDAAGEIYFPLRQTPQYLTDQSPPRLYQSLVVRTEVPPSSLAQAVRAAIQAVDKDVPVSQVTPMEDLVAKQLARPRFAMTLVSAFGFVALILAMAGIYGVVSYTVTRRAREIGIRIAIGASQRTVVAMILRQTLALVTPGVALGLAAALGLESFVRGLVFGIPPLDPVSFAAAPTLFLATALLACWLPARRAARIDPLRALRQD